MGLFGIGRPPSHEKVQNELTRKSLIKCDELVSRIRELYQEFDKSSSKARFEIAQNYSSSSRIGQPQNYDSAMQKRGISRENNIQIGDALYSYLEALIKELSDIPNQSADEEEKQKIIDYQKLYNEITLEIKGTELVGDSPITNSDNVIINLGDYQKTTDQKPNNEQRPTGTE